MSYKRKVTQAQLDTLEALFERYQTRLTFPDGYEIVEQDKAERIGGTFGQTEQRNGIYICIEPDGGCHS